MNAKFQVNIFEINYIIVYELLMCHDQVSIARGAINAFVTHNQFFWRNRYRHEISNIHNLTYF